jgi:hypothetical protein
MGNSDKLAAKSGEIADGRDGTDVTVLAEDEIIDPSDRLALIVDGFGFRLSAR